MPTTTREHDLNESEQEILARAKKERLRLWVRKCTRMFDVGGEAMSYWQKYGIACPHSRPVGGEAYWGKYLYGDNTAFCEEYSNGKCKASGTSCKGARGCKVPFPYRRACDAGKGLCFIIDTSMNFQAELKKVSVTNCPKMYSTGQPAFVDALRKHQA